MLKGVNLDILVCKDTIGENLRGSFHVETVMLSFWKHFRQCLHRKLSKLQLSLQPVTKMWSKWRSLRFSTRFQSDIMERFDGGKCPRKYFDFMKWSVLVIRNKKQQEAWWKTACCFPWSYHRVVWNFPQAQGNDFALLLKRKCFILSMHQKLSKGKHFLYGQWQKFRQNGEISISLVLSHLLLNFVWYSIW